MICHVTTPLLKFQENINEEILKICRHKIRRNFKNIFSQIFGKVLLKRLRAKVVEMYIKRYWSNNNINGIQSLDCGIFVKFPRMESKLLQKGWFFSGKITEICSIVFSESWLDILVCQFVMQRITPEQQLQTVLILFKNLVQWKSTILIKWLFNKLNWSN